MTLFERLTQINEDAKKRMDVYPGDWVGMLTTDLAHWAEYGVYSADQLNAYLDVEATRNAQKDDR
jgi:hypothetical protein